jgi:hypothetical protein
VSFASEQGRDDGSLPPVNVVIPDDARELDRDVLAYRREVRAKRRRQRLLRLIQPFNRPEFGGHAAIVPLIAICLALTLVGGALLSVATMGPAEAPTVSSSPLSVKPPVAAGSLTDLPVGTVQLDGKVVQVRSLVSSAIALVPANCGCGQALERLADQAIAAQIDLYFAATGPAIGQLPRLITSYGGGAAKPAADTLGVLSTAYRPQGLTVLLVFSDATAEVHRDILANFQFGTTLSYLKQAGRTQATT